jgi:Tol biopolymer transport system component
LQKDKHEPVQLTTGPMNLGQPVPSKDGKKLFALGRLSRGQLLRYESKSDQFVPFLSGISGTDLDFSRDGEWVAYVAVPEGTLWRSKTDGSERLQLSFPPMQAQLPRWSPDGKRIAFMATALGKPMKIYFVSTEGSSPEPIKTGEKNEWDPGWSPDGNWLAFGSTTAVETSPSALAIHLLDLRTHQLSTLPGSQGLYSPRWSPDGNHIAALKAGEEHLWLYDLKILKWEEVASAMAAYPSWSRDGKYIYFSNLPYQREAAFSRVRISDRKLEQVVLLKDPLQPYGIPGVWTGLTPDDSPLLLRNVGSEEIYALDWEAP